MLSEYVVDGFFALEMLKRRRGIGEAIKVLEKDLKEGIERLKELGLSKDQIVFLVSAVRKVPIDKAFQAVESRRGRSRDVARGQAMTRPLSY